MQQSQRVTLMIGLFLILLGGAFPPWRFVGWGVNGETTVSFDMPAGRALAFRGPEDGATDTGRRWAKIDGGRLLAEIAMIFAATGLAVCMLSVPRAAERKRCHDAPDS